MTTTAELLIELNKARENRGMKPLKAWKESRAKLEDAVAAISPQELVENPQPTADIEDEARKLEAANDADTTPKTEAKPRTKTPVRAEGTITVAELCRALGKKEKVGRAKARRWGSKLRPLMIDPADPKWTFTTDNLAAVCKVLGWAIPETLQKGGQV